MNHDRQAAPNYTNACITMFGVNIAWIFFAIWAAWGLAAAALLGWLINRVIRHIGVRRGTL
ncbi:hypothetical protein C1J03_07350 [Sulfitobacter sp. SK012]|nr:hypothetical protein C1J03_07350 [Sulfitobacter sp. SK012]